MSTRALRFGSDRFLRLILATIIFLLPLPNKFYLGSVEIPLLEALLLLAIMIGLSMLRRWWFLVSKGSLILWGMPFLMAVFLSSLVAHSPDVAMRGALYLSEGLIFASLVLCSVRDLKNARYYMITLSISGIIQSILSITQHLWPGSLTWFIQHFPDRFEEIHYVLSNTGSILRSTGTFSHPNFLGAYLSATLISCVYLSLTTKTQKYKFLFLFNSLIVSAGLFFTYSRGALIASFISIVSLVLLDVVIRSRDTNYKPKLLPAIAITVLVVCISGGFFLFSGQANAYLLDLSSGFSYRETAVEDRFFRWRAAVEIWSDHPVFGVGFNNFNDEYASRYPTVWGTDRRLSAHNLVLELLATTGMVGLLSFALLCGIVFARLWRLVSGANGKLEQGRFAIAALCFFIYFLLHHTFACYIADKNLMFVWWLFIGLTDKIISGLKSQENCSLM